MVASASLLRSLLLLRLLRSKGKVVYFSILLHDGHFDDKFTGESLDNGWTRHINLVLIFLVNSNYLSDLMLVKHFVIFVKENLRSMLQHLEVEIWRHFFILRFTLGVLGRFTYSVINFWFIRV